MLFQLRNARRDFFIDEAARSFRDHPLLFGEVFGSERLRDGAVVR